MKNQCIINTILKLVIVAMLIVAASTKQPYTFYTLLRWVVIGGYIYFAYQANVKKQVGLLIYYTLVAILFNPFYKVWFQKDVWHIVDYAVAAITAITVVYDWFQYKKSN